MRFISSLNWIKRGVSQTPTKIKVDQDEMKKIFEEEADKKPEDSDEERPRDDENDEEQDVDKKYNLDDYDQEEYELKLDRLSSLACFPTNQQDDMLTKKDDGEDSDEEDLEIKSTDNLIVCGTIEDDDSCLNIYVYNEFESSFYIHHDILLSAMPICVEWLDYDPTNPDSIVNYLAVGTLNPWIEIWDLDLMDNLEPEFVLGGEATKKKKKNAEKKKTKLVGHKDAVLDLSYNHIERNILASGSADKAIVLWDLMNLKQVVRIKGHTDRVQSIQFHPLESFSLLAGSADHTICLYDCRSPKENKKSWQIEHSVEQVLWNTVEPNKFLSSDDKGNVYLFDIRKDSEALSSTMAHEDTTSFISISQSVPGLVLTAGEDELVKIWDIKSNEPDTFHLVNYKKLKIGPINCSQASPDSPFVFAFGGIQSTEPVVWDIRDMKEVRDQFYPRLGLEEDDIEKEEAEQRQKRKARRIQRAQKFKQIRPNEKKQAEREKSLKRKIYK